MRCFPSYLDSKYQCQLANLCFICIHNHIDTRHFYHWSVTNNHGENMHYNHQCMTIIGLTMITPLRNEARTIIEFSKPLCTTISFSILSFKWRWTVSVSVHLTKSSVSAFRPGCFHLSILYNYVTKMYIRQENWHFQLLNNFQFMLYPYIVTAHLYFAVIGNIKVSDPEVFWFSFIQEWNFVFIKFLSGTPVLGIILAISEINILLCTRPPAVNVVRQRGTSNNFLLSTCYHKPWKRKLKERKSLSIASLDLFLRAHLTDVLSLITAPQICVNSCYQNCNSEIILN